MYLLFYNQSTVQLQNSYRSNGICRSVSCINSSIRHQQERTDVQIAAYFVVDEVYK